MRALQSASSSIAARAPVRAFSGTLAALIVRCLKAAGIDTAFVVPGGPIMPFIDALFTAGDVRVVMAKHEAGAVFMADGYRRVTGRMAVCVTTAGPGATNAATGIACAHADGVPILMISGQPGSLAFGRGPVQDSSPLGAADTVALFKPITKLSLALAGAARAEAVVQLLIRRALSGRPGPVHLSIPADLLRRHVSARVPPPAAYRPLGRSVDAAAIQRAARILVTCRQPVILAGWGVGVSNADSELAAVADLLGAPVATTPKGKGLYPEDRSLGVFGFAGSRLADEVIFDRRTDCLLVVGSSLGELVHAWDERVAAKRIIQIDIDPTRLGAAHSLELGIEGDAREALSRLRRSLARLPRRRPWRPRQVPLLPSSGVAAPDRCVDHEKLFDDGVPLSPQRLMGEVGRALSPDDTLFVDIGGCMAFALHYLVVRRPGAFHVNLGMASMGHAVAAVVGAQIARPERHHVCLCGDGAFLMTGAEVHTAVEANAPCVWVVMNNGGQSSVLAGIRRQFGEVGTRKNMAAMTRFRAQVDCAGMAEAMGALAFRVERPDQLGNALRAALRSGRPTVVDVRVDINAEPPLGLRLALLDRFFNHKDNK